MSEQEETQQEPEGEKIPANFNKGEFSDLVQKEIDRITANISDRGAIYEHDLFNILQAHVLAVTQVCRATVGNEQTAELFFRCMQAPIDITLDRKEIN